MTHEILYRDEWQKLFGKDHSWITLVHIPVHATLQAIFDDVLQEPVRTKNDIHACQDYHDYKKAWDYVQEVGYKTIVVLLMGSYKSLPVDTQPTK